MTAIVAFGVHDKTSGESALARLDGVAEDTAVVYLSTRGRVKIQQFSDLNAERNRLRGGLLHAAVGVFARAFLPSQAVGSRAPGAADPDAATARDALRDAGVGDALMRLAVRQLERGRAAAFILADDEAAAAIVTALQDAGLGDIQVSRFTHQAAHVVREILSLA